MMRLFSYMLFVGLFIFCSSGAVEGQGTAWTDPAKAAAEDPDFSIQGEYGSADTGADYGVQVVALGEGAFDAYVLRGGLPGHGWDRSKRRCKLSGQRTGDVIRLSLDELRMEATIQDGVMTVLQDRKGIAQLPRIERKSPTLGAKPPEGAVVLFDGTSADAWQKGEVENGLLKNHNARSKQHFQDFHMHLEFRTPYKPLARGQKRGNSGVYYQGRYETQVLDSFGLEGAKNECGAVYGIGVPRVNMCFPPLTWQTYDVDFVAAKYDDSGNKTDNARISVRHNGVLIHENLELPRKTTAAPVKEGPEPGPIFLQHHGNPVYYRNIWIVEK